ncbi:rhodanese-like domain-containing protein [Frigoriflavimonas asaccharolytica]|uniref:Rhodanese-related sulfurtransferase n=1 Tax=Frigoriflavimonas asaccharolytica TaxID=2735899 RepID=A0A8J8GB30_9FLAO|nr:rhodanese-like domain-containing protein [Frigoriflavimonas asaccharolytica]NRS92954.1 rhodanese-related sulfurtransferase [Frigoriflavimonas asaccharolytica]
MNKNTVAYIYVDDIAKGKNYTFLDSREPKEFNVSHLKNAVNIGYDKFDSKKFVKDFPNKNENIVVYCSIGIRSETIGDKLKKLGYKNVQNLYGGIFEWKNKGNKVVDKDNLETEKIHTFDKNWSKYLKKGEKVYEK